MDKFQNATFLPRLVFRITWCFCEWVLLSGDVFRPHDLETIMGMNCVDTRNMPPRLYVRSEMKTKPFQDEKFCPQNGDPSCLCGPSR